MTKKDLKYKPCFIALLLCLTQVAGIDMYAQESSKTALSDSIAVREAPKARARRHREPMSLKDSIAKEKSQILRDSIFTLRADSTSMQAISPASIDSIEAANNANLQKIETAVTLPQPKDTVIPSIPDKLWIPNPTKATWLAVVFPGGGQIYNRKFWKLPIVYGGFAGCAYALSWNTGMYKDYSQAYLDIMDEDPTTKSYEDIFGKNSGRSVDQMKSLLKSRKDMFRRYRDLSIFAFIGVYLISIIDAYVDAELSNFDITPDLSMRVEPTLFKDRFTPNSKSVGVQCSLRF